MCPLAVIFVANIPPPTVEVPIDNEFAFIVPLADIFPLAVMFPVRLISLVRF